MPAGRRCDRNGRAEEDHGGEVEASGVLGCSERPAEVERRQRSAQREPGDEPRQQRRETEKQPATVECPDASGFDGTRLRPDANSGFSPHVHTMDLGCGAGALRVEQELLDELLDPPQMRALDETDVVLDCYGLVARDRPVARRALE